MLPKLLPSWCWSERRLWSRLVSKMNPWYSCFTLHLCSPNYGRCLVCPLRRYWAAVWLVWTLHDVADGRV